MRLAIFELVFFLVILKIPVAYLLAVVWWAIRAEPRPPEGAALGLETDPRLEPPGGLRRRPRRRAAPRRGPSRSHGPRSARAHARLGR